MRKSGNKVRITAQLIRTADRTHLWSESYDRSLDDIFAVQDKIADAIAQALQIRLTGGELNRRKDGTQNLGAYQLYLRGVSAVNEKTQASLDAAGKYLEQAVEIDPAFGRGPRADCGDGRIPRRRLGSAQSQRRGRRPHRPGDEGVRR